MSYGAFSAGVPHSLSDLAEVGKADLRGDDRTVATIGPVEDCPRDALTFLASGKYASALEGTQAAAIVVAPTHADRVPPRCTALVADEPYRAFAKMAAVIFPSAMVPQGVTDETGIAASAAVHPTARVEDGVTVETGAVVGAGAVVGSGTRILAYAVVGPSVRVGSECVIGTHASVVHSELGDRVIVHSGARLGQDGFGYAMGPQGHLKVPQVGRVVIGDDVEIGANTTIDRGANRDTMIGDGTKIDNLVQIGHNCRIGRHCVIVANVGIAGSTELGDFAVLGGGAGVTGHVKIGAGAQVAGMSGVADDIPAGQAYGGIPARPVRHWMKEVAAIRRAIKAEDKRKR